MKFRDRQILFSLSRTAVIFFLGLCLFSLFLYAAGTRQGFADNTQLFLLGLSRNLGLALSICSIWGIFFCVFLIIRGPRLRLALRMGLYLLLCFFGIAVNLLVSFIIAAAEGNA
jgi:ABC-type transport system involved in multi-copper enzyme maturation permease subunit